MARYFFHTQTAQLVPDHEGTELADLNMARASAARSFGELIKDQGLEFWSTRPWSITVTDNAGLILFVLEMHGLPSPACPT